MIERQYAHPVLDASALPSDAPLALRLLGEDWVAWRDGSGTPRAAPDPCPHRGTRLSLGRVCAGELECAYHGWRFGGDGRCTRIPALPGFEPPASHGLATRALAEFGSLLWLQPDDTAPLTLPSFAAETGAALRKLSVGPYDVATSAPRIVENFLDLAHFGFVHEGWLGDREHTAVETYAIEQTLGGFAATGCRAWQPRSHLRAAAGGTVEYRYELLAPFAALLRKIARGTGEVLCDEIALFICPVEPEASRVWFRLAVSDHTSSDDELRAFQHAIFMQDKPILEAQSPRRLPLGVGEVHCAADRSSSAYRRLLFERGVGFGVSRRNEAPVPLRTAGDP